MAARNIAPDVISRTADSCTSTVTSLRSATQPFTTRQTISHAPVAAITIDSTSRGTPCSMANDGVVAMNRQLALMAKNSMMHMSRTCNRWLKVIEEWKQYTWVTTLVLVPYYSGRIILEDRWIIIDTVCVCSWWCVQSSSNQHERHQGQGHTAKVKISRKTNKNTSGCQPAGTSSMTNRSVVWMSNHSDTIQL